MENEDSNLGSPPRSVPFNLGRWPASSSNRTSYSFQTWCLQVVCAAHTWKHLWVNQLSLCGGGPLSSWFSWASLLTMETGLLPSLSAMKPCHLLSFLQVFIVCVCVCVCVSMCDQSCLTLWDSTGYSPPGSSVHGILQVIPEGVVISYSRGPS